MMDTALCTQSQVQQGVRSKAVKRVIKNQLDKDIIDSSFDVGFMQNNSAISIRSDEDLIDIWDDVMV